MPDFGHRLHRRLDNGASLAKICGRPLGFVPPDCFMVFKEQYFRVKGDVDYRALLTSFGRLLDESRLRGLAQWGFRALDDLDGTLSDMLDVSALDINDFDLRVFAARALLVNGLGTRAVLGPFKLLEQAVEFVLLECSLVALQFVSADGIALGIDSNLNRPLRLRCTRPLKIILVELALHIVNSAGKAGKSMGGRRQSQFSGSVSQGFGRCL